MTFNSMGGSSVPSQTVYRTYPIRRPADPTRRGHIFTGWYSDEACEHQWDFKTVKNIDMTLYARWIEGDYLVTFNTNGGSPVAPEPVKGNNTISPPQDPTRSGYTFDGWYTDNGSFRNKWNFNTPPASNITLYAKWNFGGSVLTSNSIDVYNADQWDTAVTTINSGSGDYMINIRANFNLDGVTANTFSRTNINVHINGNGYTISLSEQGSLLRIGSDQTVYMLGLTLRGSAANNTSLVYIDGGTFTMESGTITGNTHSQYQSNGGGVYIPNGTFTMNGGTISGNTANGAGGGVQIGESYYLRGTFNMNGGTISGNTASTGGGVCVISTFNMNGGEVSGNTATDYGGGVSLGNFATFTMNGGTISRNTAKGGGGVYTTADFYMNGGEVSDNTAADKGGGIYVWGNITGNFTMTGGYVSRNTAATEGGGVYIGDQTNRPLSFRISNGTVYGNNGGSNSNKAQNGAALYKAASATAQYGKDYTWTDILESGATDRNATIRVVNGVLQ